MQKIEYKKVPKDILSLPTLGSEGWIYTFCPFLEEKNHMLVYRPIEKEKKTRVKGEIKLPEYSETFEEFWKIYPRKEVKPSAFKMWERLSEEEKGLAMKAIPFHAGYHKQNNTPKNRIPHPATWLNPELGRYWENDLGGGVKTADQLKDEEKRIEELRKNNEKKKIIEDREKEEAKRVENIFYDLQVHSPERFASLKSEAEKKFTDVEKSQAWYEYRLNAAIRGLITERYIEKKTLQNPGNK